MKKILLWLIILSSSSLFAQEGKVSGVVKDALTGETIPSAVVVWGEKKDKGVICDINGNFVANVPKGRQVLYFSAVGYIDQNQEVTVGVGEVSLEINLVLQNQKELIIVTDLAVGRKVPVAYSNIDMKRIDEELAGREMATLANTTPGAYATRTGGGDGDARVTIRGFSGNNVAVMLDGVPVNDMENGTVYWSNWFGLDLVTQTTQIQRGLGASKLVIPAVGGTMNIITRGIDQKRRIQVKQEYAFGAFGRTSFGMNTGKLKNGWAFSTALSLKDGKGWVDGTSTRGFFGFFKVEKVIKNHILSFYALGAPQTHGQRSRAEAIALYDRETAVELGANTTYYLDSNNPNVPIFDGGINYNPDVGYLTRYQFRNGVVSEQEPREMYNGRRNFYFKPQLSLKDIWNINEHSFLSTVGYLSLGSGGGTRWNATITSKDYLPDGSLNVQSFYDTNIGANPPLFTGPDYNINPDVSSTERYAVSNYLKASMNDHFWVGALSTYNNQVNENWSLSGGLDVRYYKGSHYRKIIDLLGADYVWMRANYDANDPNLIKREGDVIDYNNDAFIRWGGLFGQAEYQDKRWSAFLSASAAMTGYNRVDYFLPKVVDHYGAKIPVGYVFENNSTTLISDTTNFVSMVINQGDTNYVNSATFYSGMPGSEYQSTGWYYRPTFTIKSGVKYAISDPLSVFLNVGYLDKAPLFNQIYNNSNERFNQIINEKIFSVENGWSWKNKELAWNVNAYYTTWKNKPFPYGLSVPNPMDPTSFISVNVQGMNARHMGVEWDAALKVTDRITVEILTSVADWIWTSSDTIFVFDDANRPVPAVADDPSAGQYKVIYDANGVHVSDAAQTQFGAMVRYEWKNGAYVKGRYTWFERYYGDFNPFTLNGANAGRDSWLLPGYGTAELHAGYSLYDGWKTKWDIRGSVFNLFNDAYITDATNNSQNALYNDKNFNFGASSAGVFFGQGRWYSLSLTATF